jgi:hypothetical protein
VSERSSNISCNEYSRGQGQFPRGPPGARFDPYGPPSNPYGGPDFDDLPPPGAPPGGYDNMFM